MGQCLTYMWLSSMSAGRWFLVHQGALKVHVLNVQALKLPSDHCDSGVASAESR